MPVLPILTIPHPLLKRPSAPLSVITPEIIRFTDDLTETMRHYRHCVGLAAPQAGKSVRLIVIDVSLHAKPHPNHGLLVLVNPAVTAGTEPKTGREGCLSVPDFTGNVTRFQKITVTGTDIEGRNVTIHSSGFEAVVLQHEIDHLDGILFLDRVSSLKTDVFRRNSCLDNPPKKG